MVEMKKRDLFIYLLFKDKKKKIFFYSETRYAKV